MRAWGRLEAFEGGGARLFAAAPPPPAPPPPPHYGSVLCSLMGSPCLGGWLGEVACDGWWLPGGKAWLRATPPGTRPSRGPGIPPGATPTMPGGNLEERVRRKESFLCLSL